jgi:hypothetical protein
VDLKESLGHGLYFLSTDKALESMKLAIKVRDTYFIKIDERELTYSTSRERLCGPRSNTA